MIFSMTAVAGMFMSINLFSERGSLLFYQVFFLKQAKLGMIFLGVSQIQLKSMILLSSVCHSIVISHDNVHRMVVENQ